MPDRESQDTLLAKYLTLAPRSSEVQVLRLVIETGVRSIGAEGGSLLLYNPDANDLTFTIAYPESDEEVLIGQRVPLGQGITGLAAETGEVQIGAPRYHDVEQRQATSEIQAVIAAPMMIQDRLIGVITAVSREPGRRFTMADAELYACLTTIAALVVDQALLLRASSTEEPLQTPVALASDPEEQEVIERMSRLLRRDRNTVRHLARMLEAVEEMAQISNPQ
jgi:GAF domain-containing protein